MVTKPSRVNKINYIHNVNTLKNLPEKCDMLIKAYEEMTGISYGMAKSMVEEEIVIN